MADANSELADKLNDEARDLEDPEAALALYRRALALDPDRAGTLYNIGLIHKYRSEWRESQEFNRRSVALRLEDEAANWNLAIASTALRDWATARSVWRRLGVLDDAGDGPILDPVRARIRNIPYPESGFRFGDIVLHDGAPVGTRESGGREYSVFNALELFEGSDWSTYVAEIQMERDDDAAELTTALDEADVPNEDWTTSVRMLCKQCSEGRAHETHDHDLAQEWRDRHVIGIAAKDPAYAQEIIRKWASTKRWLVRFELRLAPPAKH